MSRTILKTVNGAEATDYSFGTMQFGSNADAAESRAMYDACRDAGINFFDTAYVYSDGESERLLGEFVASERDDILIASKCGMSADQSDANIRKQVDESLSRLGMDMVDIMYLHKFDPIVPLEVSFETLAALQKQGKFRYIGVSNYAAWQVMKAQWIANDLGTRIDILQPMYNLVKRQAEVELLPMAISEGFNVAPYSPLGGGLLTGKYAVGGKGRLDEMEMYAKRYDVDWMRQTAADLAALGQKIGVHPATLAVTWMARHPGVTQPIISARSVAQLQASLDAISFEMTDDLYTEISALSQKPAPATDRLEEG